MLDAQLRYRTSSLALADSLAPVYPLRDGTEYYSEPLEHPEYLSTRRDYPAATVTLETENCKDPSSLETFWDTTLARGEYDMTLIDDRKRFLFDVFWGEWHKRWRKSTGGIYDISAELVSPYDWTSPMFGFYALTANNLADHGLEAASDLTAVDGTLVNYATDTNILRRNGYALRIANAGAAPTGASSSSLVWKRRKAADSLSLFAQVRLDDLASANNRVDIIHLTDGANIFEIEAEIAADGSGWYLDANLQESGESVESIAGTAKLSENTWYDVCMTFDSVTSRLRVYWAASPTNPTVQWATTNDYLYGMSTLTDGLLSAAITNYPTSVTWTTCYLLKSNAAAPFAGASDYAYTQNAMIIDEFIPPLEFNRLRRLCHVWNGKTTGTWPA